jgi:hypothetical protein
MVTRVHFAPIYCIQMGQCLSSALFVLCRCTIWRRSCSTQVRIIGAFPCRQLLVCACLLWSRAGVLQYSRPCLASCLSCSSGLCPCLIAHRLSFRVHARLFISPTSAARLSWSALSRVFLTGCLGVFIAFIFPCLLQVSHRPQLFVVPIAF